MVMFNELPHGFLPVFEDGKPTLDCKHCGRRWDDKLHQEGSYQSIPVDDA